MEILEDVDQLLEKSVKELKNCQESNKLKSCLSCSKLLICDIRLLYVNLIYKSMNKKESGGFEF